MARRLPAECTRDVVLEEMWNISLEEMRDVSLEGPARVVEEIGSRRAGREGGQSQRSHEMNSPTAWRPIRRRPHRAKLPTTTTEPAS